jgi:hypothetical protein
MKISAGTKRAFILFWAASIAWIYIGLLVNFHQHRIWHRELIPQFLAAKSHTEKSLKAFIPGKSSVDRVLNSPVPFTDPGLLNASDHPLPGINILTSRVNSYSWSQNDHFIITSGLRAPPVA